MIQTAAAMDTGRVDHIGVGTIKVKDLLGALDATQQTPTGVLWDFRQVEFQVPLWVVNSPSYAPVRDRMNQNWLRSRVGFVVNSHTHKHMIELFAAEGAFSFDWKVFFNMDEAHCWLRAQPTQAFACH